MQSADSLNKPILEPSLQLKALYLLTIRSSGELLSVNIKYDYEGSSLNFY